MSCKRNDIMDVLAIIAGLVSIIVNFTISDNSDYALISKMFICVATLFWLGYTIYVIKLWCRRADFDWHLINGHFLRKVCCYVILTPSFLATVGYLGVVSSTKELAFQEELYECADSSLPCYIKHKQESPNIFWSTYFHFIDPGNQHMTTTKVGRIWAAIIAIFGVFLLNGLLVSSIIGWIDQRKGKWQTGAIRYKVRHLGKYQYAVVIGANEIASSVIRNLFMPKTEGDINYKCEGNNQYVILHTSRNPSEVRSELSSHLDSHDMSRLIIYKGLRDSATEIR